MWVLVLPSRKELYFDGLAELLQLLFLLDVYGFCRKRGGGRLFVHRKELGLELD